MFWRVMNLFAKWLDSVSHDLINPLIILSAFSIATKISFSNFQ